MTTKLLECNREYWEYVSIEVIKECRMMKVIWNNHSIMLNKKMNQDDEQFHQVHHELIIDENHEQLFEIVSLKYIYLSLPISTIFSYHFQWYTSIDKDNPM